MPSTVRTRSGREVKNSSTAQSKLDALELLARQRRGEKVEVAIKEDAPLFEEVNEDEYRNTRKGGFIVDPESGDEIGSDSDSFIDDDDDHGDDRARSSKPRGKGRGSKFNDTKPDARQRSMKSFLGGGSSSKASKSHVRTPTMPSHSKKPEVNQDDILSQMLFDVPVNRSSPAQKPLKVLSRLSTPKTLKTKANFEPASVKRPRLLGPSPTDDVGNLDDWMDDDFNDIQLPPTSDAPVVSVKEEIVPEVEELPDNSGIEAIPLNEDLKSNLEFYDHPGDKKYTRLYWYDCCEDPVKSPGVVYFFGRIYATTAKRYVSCCTIVKNVQRTIYLLITHDSTYEQAVGEFTHITAKRFRLKNFSCEKVTKKYAFSPDSKVPLVAEYVKVDYPATLPPLPSNLVGETFSHVLNVNQTPMEKIILDLKLRGPCWLKVVDPVAPNSPLTWTRVELILETPQNLVVEESQATSQVPYFCTFALSLRTYKNPHTSQNEIIAITGMVNTAFNLDQCLKRTNKASGHFCLMTKPAAVHKELKLPYDFHKDTVRLAMQNRTKTMFELFDSERDLLIAFMEKFTTLDPDIVVGHDLLNFDYETLVARMNVMKVGAWSKFGRFKTAHLPSTKAAFRYMFSGRVMCDIRSSAMELIHARSYDLTELALQVLKKTRVEYNHTALIEAYKSSEGLIGLLNATWEDTDSIFSILVELNVIPLALKITNITGNILSRTLAAGRSERNEYLLLHAFHEENFICPEKKLNKFQKARENSKGVTDEPKELAPVRKKAAYSGGLVLEPKAGYYDTCVLLMDFNSLYPSIIQEFNICFSTVKVPETDGSDVNAELIANVPDESLDAGILPTQLKNLVEGRRRVKRLLAEAKTPEQKMLLDIEQKALKLTANSMYGCLGFEQSRFYAKHLASLVTFKGREILMSTKAMVEKLGYEVIYGDTDSLMINTKIVDYDEVIQRGNSIKGEINRTFKLLEIDIDGVYRPLLLLKKKNYAGASIKKQADGQGFSSSIETKGLDTVRRDRAVIAKEAGEKVLSMILSDGKDIDQTVEDIHNYLKQLGESVRSGEIPKDRFLISKQLNRNPEEYRDTKGLGHVTLSLRYNNDTRRSRKLRAGDTIEYVICSDNTTESANQRAYTLEEMAENSDLKLDYEYYLCQQIHPVMTRICDKLPVTNAYVLAEMLGIEKSSMLHIRREESEGTKRDQLISKGAARFNSCKPLVINCPNCNLPDEVTTRTRQNKSKKWEFSLANCPQCGVRYATRGRSILVQVIALIKKLMTDLHSSKYVCENTECEYQTRNVFCRLSVDDVSSSTAKAQPICDMCESPMMVELDDRKVDLQLSFIKYLFDAGREQENGQLEKPSEDLLELYKRCFNEVDYALRCSFVNNIDASSMFGMICSGRKFGEVLST